MDILQSEIKRLEEEKLKLMTDRDYNKAKIDEYNRLIGYYCMLYNNVLSSINSNRDVLGVYQAILVFKDRMRSPSWMENFSFLSDEHLKHMISKIETLILKLNERSMNLKEKVHECQKTKMDMVLQNSELEERIEVIDLSLNDRIPAKRQMVKERVKQFGNGNR